MSEINIFLHTLAFTIYLFTVASQSFSEMFLLGPANSVEYQRNRMSGIDQIPQSARVMLL